MSDELQRLADLTAERDAAVAEAEQMRASVDQALAEARDLGEQAKRANASAGAAAREACALVTAAQAAIAAAVERLRTFGQPTETVEAHAKPLADLRDQLHNAAARLG